MNACRSSLVLLVTVLALLTACGTDNRTAGATQPTIVTVLDPTTGQPVQGTIVDCNGIQVAVRAEDYDKMITQCGQNGTVPPTPQSPQATPEVVNPAPLATPATLPQTGEAKQGDLYYGEGFTVECDRSCEAAKVQVYFPSKPYPFAEKEIHTIIRGCQAVEFPGAGGTYWKYPRGYNVQSLERQMSDDAVRRADEANYYGFVKLQQLIDAGLAIELYGGCDGQEAPTPIPTTVPLVPTAIATFTPHAPATPMAACIEEEPINREPEVGVPWHLDLDQPAILSFWTNEPDQKQEKMVMLLNRATVKLLGGGTLRKWPAGCETARDAAFAKYPASKKTTYQAWIVDRNLVD